MDKPLPLKEAYFITKKITNDPNWWIKYATLRVSSHGKTHLNMRIPKRKYAILQALTYEKPIWEILVHIIPFEAAIAKTHLPEWNQWGNNRNKK